MAGQKTMFGDDAESSTPATTMFGDAAESTHPAIQSPGRGGGSHMPDQPRVPVQDPGFGMPTFATGVGNVLTPGSRMQGIHQVIKGAGEIASPALLPALAGAPAATLAGMASGAITGGLGKVGSSMAGASPEASDVIGDVAGLAGGYSGSKLGGAVQRVVTNPSVQGAVESMYPKVAKVGHAVIDSLRGNPEAIMARSMPPVGPRETVTMPSGRMAPVMPFKGQDFTPPQLERAEPVGKPGAVLPGGSVVGPASPSRINPPEPRGNPPRVPQTVRIGIPSAAGPGPLPDAAPIYPASPVLPSGRSFGPRPSLGESSPGIVINGPVRPPLATGTNQVAVPQLTPIQPSFASSKEATVFSNSSPHAGPYGTRATLGTQAEMMRQNRLARGLEAPQAETPPPDTPASVRDRASQSRARFDENGKRNQLKSK